MNNCKLIRHKVERVAQSSSTTKHGLFTRNSINKQRWVKDLEQLLDGKKQQ